MFKFLVIATLLGATAALRPQPSGFRQPPQRLRVSTGHDGAEVARLASQINEDGSYGYEYELSNGAAAQESGIGGHQASGTFRHISPEGEQIQLSYTADENGFHPQGAHLPTPPPIPEEIINSIKYIRAHPSAEEQKDRQIRLQNNQ